MLATPAPPLPRLTHITAAPVFGPGGTLQTTPGYCPASGSYFSPPSGSSLRPVSEHPSETEIHEARGLIVEEVLGDFPFVSPADLATGVSAMLTPFVQQVIDDSVPLHVFDKPVHRTGTSLAADVCAIPINGPDRGVLAPADSESEWRKRITAELIASPPTITIDNAGQLDSASLAVVLTAAVWRDRVLGRSEIVNLPARAVWSATGTNIDLSVELARRSTLSRMDARLENPEQRTDFRHSHLRSWAREHRADVVWALLTLVRVWLMRGRPGGRVTLGGYERWAEVVGGILDLAGIPGLLANLSALHESPDPDAHAWHELVLRWQFFHPDNEPVGVRDLWGLLTIDGQTIDFDLGTGDPSSRRTRFGKRLSKQRDKVIGGYQIVRAGKRQGAQLWQLTPAANVEP